jgi:hypothetical protein
VWPHEKRVSTGKDLTNEAPHVSPVRRRGYCERGCVRDGRCVDAAAVIHSDIARGFIRAEIVNYDHFMFAGSMHQAKEAGHVRLEGKEYFVQDGDIILFRFNV